MIAMHTLMSRMMKTWIKFLTASLLSIGVAYAAPQPKNQSAENTLKAKLSKDFPQITVKSVSNTPLPGIYEVYTDQRIVYTNTEAKYFLVGNLIDLAAQKDLTEEREQTLKAINVSQLPLNQAIQHIKGKGERNLYVFTDPDCPYCHKLDAELEKLDNVRIYTFMLPIPSLHPNATRISEQVWCSKDQHTAWTDYTLKQKMPTASNTCKNPIAKNIELGKRLEVTSTPTLFLSNGHRISGARAASDLEILMQQAVEKK